ncbi:L-ascorbate metabolism protein UlaG (beta-lactamase superfamily) [Kribbella steppae]|uniref:L-ascorbate metabolism protein UlaG (Beta-lactamase superfamily) n=1 Tax=Kribbella steppae TaxID=2512223 RepID=A0A4R2HH18_9ACTN|nr:MBL fold metallo-hydrolase [Kribbella steppae]TCO28471.1 L-ascorbate metabolism protein UlaG (beta-lactamase superfamily) [Kribbella steppae]
MSLARITHIGGPTTLIEVDGWRLLTDPTFDPPGRRYSFGWGSSSVKLVGPALGVDELPEIDAVLLTHDQHADNLDDLGRALLPRVGAVVTTVTGAARLGGGAVGLAPWAVHTLNRPGRPPLSITATPCRHGPPLSRSITGDVIGFAVEWPGQEHGALWVSGDSVLYDGMRQVGGRFDVGTVLLHLGAVRFGVTGPLRYSMTGRDGVELCSLLRPQTVIPVHYEGWSHFSQGRSGVAGAFAAGGLEARWLELGVTGLVSV